MYHKFSCQVFPHCKIFVNQVSEFNAVTDCHYESPVALYKQQPVCHVLSRTLTFNLIHRTRFFFLHQCNVTDVYKKGRDKHIWHLTLDVEVFHIVYRIADKLPRDTNTKSDFLNKLVKSFCIEWMFIYYEQLLLC